MDIKIWCNSYEGEGAMSEYCSWPWTISLSGEIVLVVTLQSEACFGRKYIVTRDSNEQNYHPSQTYHPSQEVSILKH